MVRPSLPPAAEALFRAHQDKSTGWLTLLCGGREAKLYLQHGDLVGARLGFGHQTDAQALLASGALVPPALDLLWARGQLGDPARVCEAAGVDPTGLSETRALASVRRVATLAEEASFMPALVEVTFPRVRGARAVRAAFEALPAVPATAWVRCRDVSAAEPFLSSTDERTFLASIAEFRPAETLSPVQSALLRALEHAGLVEVLSPDEWQARAGAEREEAARLAEEESRREAARHALEAARAAEERRQSEMRDRADAARRALEAARAAEAAWRRAREEGPGVEPPAVHTTERDFPAGPQGQVTAPEFPPPDASSDFGPPAPVHTEREFHALAEDMPPLEPPPPAMEMPPADEAAVPVLTRTTLASFESPVHSTDPMGAPPVASSLGDEDTLVRAMEHARGHTDPFAALPHTPPPRPARTDPPAPPRAGTDPYAGGEVATRQTDPYAQALPRDTPPQGTDELPTPPSQPFSFPPAAAARTPPGGTGEARTPPGGIMLESEELVLEPEALLLTEPAPTPAAGSLVDELSEALRRAGSEPPPDLFQSPSTEAVGSRLAERTPLRLGPESAEPDADLWKLASGAPAEQPGSFEAALKQVDGQLEALAGLRAPTDPENPSTVPLATTDLDALVKASFESGEWTMAPPGGEGHPPGQRPHRPRGPERDAGARSPSDARPHHHAARAACRPPAGAAPPGPGRRRARAGGQHPHAAAALARGRRAGRCHRGPPRGAHPGSGPLRGARI